MSFPFLATLIGAATVTLNAGTSFSWVSCWFFRRDSFSALRHNLILVFYIDCVFQHPYHGDKLSSRRTQH
jgi:hypothetical protein